MTSQHPRIIQGGMGVGISSWQLAKAVSQCGELGVVSGTALDVTLARRLQDGDKDGHLRFALEHFPHPGIVDEILARYFIPGGKAPEEPYKTTPMPSVDFRPSYAQLVVVANFSEVFLAKHGHDGIVGINYLEKISLPLPAAIYGAMLAGVDYILIGAGIPRRIPGILDKYVRHEAVKYPLPVTGHPSESSQWISFDPKAYFPPVCGLLKRPIFLPIISSHILANLMAKKADGKIGGFVIEGPSAGGHNAPIRTKINVSTVFAGDEQFNGIDFEQIRALKLPFWLAGGQATPQNLKTSLSIGGAGIQVGTAFAFCQESGLDKQFKDQILDSFKLDQTRVQTEMRTSPTGLPFKVAQLDGTLSDENIYALRKRVCDLGFLRETFYQRDGRLGYRCPAEPIDKYVGKGGDISMTTDRKCLCNALLANISLGQRRSNEFIEPPLITCGDSLLQIKALVTKNKNYTAKDVIDYLLSLP